MRVLKASIIVVAGFSGVLGSKYASFTFGGLKKELTQRGLEIPKFANKLKLQDILEKNDASGVSRSASTVSNVRIQVAASVEPAAKKPVRGSKKTKDNSIASRLNFFSNGEKTLPKKTPTKKKYTSSVGGSTSSSAKTIPKKFSRRPNKVSQLKKPQDRQSTQQRSIKPASVKTSTPKPKSAAPVKKAPVCTIDKSGPFPWFPIYKMADLKKFNNDRIIQILAQERDVPMNQYPDLSDDAVRRRVRTMILKMQIKEEYYNDAIAEANEFLSKPKREKEVSFKMISIFQNIRSKKVRSFLDLIPGAKIRGVGPSSIALTHKDNFYTIFMGLTEEQQGKFGFDGVDMDERVMKLMDGAWGAYCNKYA